MAQPAHYNQDDPPYLDDDKCNLAFAKFAKREITESNAGAFTIFAAGYEAGFGDCKQAVKNMTLATMLHSMDGGE